MALPTIERNKITFVQAVQVAKDQQGEWDQVNCRPVWIVTLRDANAGANPVQRGVQINRNRPTTKVVVKAELSGGRGALLAAGSAKQGAKLMQQVSNAVEAEPLGPQELRALAEVQPAFYGNGQTGRLGSDYLRYMEGGGNAVTWLKMAFVANLRDMKGMVEANKAAKLLEKMKTDQGVLHTLGMVVAVDIFIGNQDRFVHEAGSRMGTVQNIGNLLFQKQGDKRYMAVGLDWYESQGEFSNLTQDPDERWPGMMLSHKGTDRLCEFAIRAIDGLNEKLGQALSGMEDPPSLIPGQGVVWFTNGLSEGRNALWRYLSDQSQTGQPLAKGVRRRMEKLGWQQ